VAETCTRYYSEIRNNLPATILLKMIQKYDSLDAHATLNITTLCYLIEVSCHIMNRVFLLQRKMYNKIFFWSYKNVTVCTCHTVCLKYFFYKYIKYIKYIRSVFRNLANERLVYQNSMLRHVSPYLST